MNRTKNYNLPQWELGDLIRMEDFNGAMSSLEDGLTGNKAEAKADAAEAKSIANSAKVTANAAKSTADAALAAIPYVTGSYVGTGSSRSINLGFRPRFVIVSGMEHHIGNAPNVFTNYTAITGGRLLPGEIWFTDTGFTVSGRTGWAPVLSDNGRTYDYIAFR